MSFARKLGDNYGKKLMQKNKNNKNTATKTGLNAAETAFKRVVQKTAEAAEI